MKKTLFLIILSLISLAGCQQEVLVEKDVHPVFEALTEDFSQGTKTMLSEGRNIVWSSGDKILVHEGGCNGNIYDLQESSAGTSNASFTISGDRIQGYDFDANVAVYPSHFVEALSSSDGVYTLNVTIPSEQEFTQGSFAAGAFPMTALTVSKEDKRLKFKNVSGAVRLSLKGDELIRRIIFSGKSGEVLAGDAVISIDPEDGVPTLTMSESGSKEVVMTCGDDGVQLSPYKATEFVFSVPPYPFDGGFEFKVILDDETEYVLETDKSNPVLRSSVLNMPLCKVDGTVLDEMDEPVFEITELNAVNVELTANLGEVEYYLGGQEYQAFDSNAALQRMNDISQYDNPTDYLIHNEYPFGFVGNPGDFVDTFHFDYYPQFEYTVWVIPYIEGKKDYTEEDIFKVVFNGPCLQPGGTINLTPQESVVNETSITMTFEMNGAHAIDYAWVNENEVQDLGEAELRDIIINRHSITTSESLTYWTMPEETMVLLAVAIDSEGRVGGVYKEKFTTSSYNFNDLEVSVDVTEEISMSGGSFNITVSEPAYGYFSILMPSWWNQYTETSDIDRWMISNVGNWGYIYDTETPTDSFVYQHYEQLDLGSEYTLFVIAKDAEGKYSRNATYSFYPRPDEPYSSDWSIIGYFNDWNGDLMMEESGNYFVYENFTLEPQYSEEGNLLPLEFKFRNDCSWNIDIGADGFFTHELSVPYQTAFRGQNIVVPDYGTYDIYLSKYLNKYYIIPQGEKPSDYVGDEN